MVWRQLFQDMKTNLLSTRLMPLKFLFLAMYAGNTALYPYLAVHLQSLGFRADKAAVVLAIVPLISMMGPTAAGVIADKLGNFKAFFSSMVALSGAVSLLLLAVPEVPDPPGLSLTLVTDDHPPEVPLGTDIIVEHLTYEESNRTVDAEFLQWLVVTNQTRCTIHDQYQTTMDGLLMVDIGHAEPKATVNLTQVAPATDNVTLLVITSHHPISCPHDLPKRKVHPQGVALIHQILKDYNTTEILQATHPLDIHWPVRGGVDGAKALWSTGCTIKVPGLCEHRMKEIVAAESVSFWTYLITRSLLNSAINAAFTLFEGATLSMLMEHQGDYGLQRMWGYIGSMVVTPLSGWMIDRVSVDLSTPDYRPAFYFFVGMMVISGIVALSVDLKFRQPNDAVMANIFMFMRNPECIMLFLAMLLAGSFYGFLEAFLFWYLGDMGASRYLMGLTVTAGAGAAVPFLIIATPIIKKFGHINMLGFAFLMYALRFTGYAVIERPEQAMQFELLEGITMGLMLSAAYMYAASLSTKNTIVSLQAIAGTLHHGVGKGLGTLIGGHMYHHMGARKTFRFFTMYSIISSIVFFMFHLLYIRRRSRKISDLPIFGIDPSEALISVELSRMAAKMPASGRSHGRGSIAYLTDTNLDNAVVEVAPRYRRVCPQCLEPSDTADSYAQTCITFGPDEYLDSEVSSEEEEEVTEESPLRGNR